MSVPGYTLQTSGMNSSSSNQPLLNPLSESSSNSSPEIENVTTDPEPVHNPRNISIGHVYVYNFSPLKQVENTDCYNFSPPSQADSVIEIPAVSPKDSISRFNAKVISPAASSGPICRICREGDGKEDLLSPCNCAGTVGLVHISCIERWLSMSGSDRCEICHYAFATIRYPRPFSEYVRSHASHSGQRSLNADAICFLLLTPLATVSCFLSVEGAKRQVESGNSIEAGCLMALATFLLTLYFVWNIMAIRYHTRKFLRWRLKNQNVKVMIVRRLSSTNGNPAISGPWQSESQRIHIPERQSATDRQNSSNSETRGMPHVAIANDDVFVYPHCGDFRGSDFLQHLTVMLETSV